MGFPSPRRPEGRAQTPWEPNAGATTSAELLSSGSGLGRSSVPRFPQRKEKEGAGGDWAGQGPCGSRALLADAPGHGALSRAPLHQVSSPGAASPCVSPSCSHRAGLGPHSVLTFESGRWAAAASRPGCGSHARSPTPSRTPESPSQTAPLWLAATQPGGLRGSFVWARRPTVAAAAPRSPRPPGTMRWAGREPLHAPRDRWACASEGARGLGWGCRWVAWRLSVCAASSVRVRGCLWACLAIELSLRVIFLKFAK